MNRDEAIKYAKEYYLIDITKEQEYCALVRIRPECDILPEIGTAGGERDKSEWALLDMAGKVDTGCYGFVYYFGTPEEWHDNRGLQEQLRDFENKYKEK